MPRVACTDCTSNCARLHQENKPTITRFFKVILGKDHDKVMHLPPDIARSVEHLAGERFLLEDSDGRRCPVLLSHFEGSLAFTEGWFSFFREHDLEETSFLTFEYMEGSIILFVRVFAKSGGEIVHINSKGNFRRRVSNNEEDPDVKENLSDKSIPENMVLESDKDGVEVEMGIQGESDMFDAADKSDEDVDVNRILTNLEAMEIPDKFGIGSSAEAIDSDTDSADEVIEIEEDYGSKAPDAETEFDRSSGLKVNASKMGKKAKTKAKGRKTQMAANQVDGDGDRSLDETFVKAVPKKQPKDGGNLNKKIPDFSPHSMNRRITRSATGRLLTEERNNFIGQNPDKQYGRKRRIPEMDDDAQIHSVKVDPHLSDDEHRNLAHDTFSVVVTSREHLELPIEGSPVAGYVCYLKDPSGRVWPVVCRGNQFEKQLVANWDLFCSANNISEGDTCKFFKVGKLFRSYRYRVDVARRSR